MNVGSCTSCSSHVNPAKERNVVEIQKDIAVQAQQQPPVSFQPDPSKIVDISA